MRLYRRDDGFEEFWPAYTDILMVISLVLILLVVTFVLNRSDDHIKQEQERLKQAFETRFNQVLAAEKAKGLVRLASPPGERQIVSFSDQLLFDAGDAEIKRQAGKASLAKLSSVLAQGLRSGPWFKTVKVNGHTDEDPIKTERYPSNWHLSSARATSVVYFFVQHGINPHILSATGFAEFRPFDPYGRRLAEKARKRRIEIEILYPEDWIIQQEKARGSKAS